MGFKLTHDLHRMANDVRQVAKDAAFAQVLALTRTGQDIQRAHQERMKQVFDRPTPFALRAIQLVAATKAKPEAIVKLRSDGSGGANPTNFLGPEISGGRRKQKKFESLLQSRGLMPKGWFARPTRHAQLDSFGNLARSQINDILRQLTPADAPGKRRLAVAKDARSTRTRARQVDKVGGEFFAVVQRSGGPRSGPGIYQVRTFGFGRAEPRQIIRFVRSVVYPAQFDFEGIATKEARESLAKNMTAELDKVRNRTRG